MYNAVYAMNHNVPIPDAVRCPKSKYYQQRNLFVNIRDFL